VLTVVIVLFLTLPIGAYFVYDGQISNVVANTYHSASAGSILSVSAVGLYDNEIRTVWIDPQINVISGSTLGVDPQSGVEIGTVKTDGNGTISMSNFTISQSVLSEIADDGNSVHSVWIIGLNGTASGSTLVPITSDSEQNYTVATEGSGLTFFVTLFTFVVPVQFSLGTLFIVIWTIFVLLFAMSLNGPFRNVVSALRQTSEEGLQGIFSNSSLAMAALFTVVLWVSIILAYLQQSVGVSTGSLPPTDPLLEFIELSIAPIREELGFRVIPIGVVAFLILLSKSRFRDALLSLWHPSKYLKKADTPQEYRRDLSVIYVMFGVSALLFGLAHYLLGSGWGPGKITEAAVAGVALAALYYQYGLPAAILLHWSIDYALTALTFSSSLLVVYSLFVFLTGGVAIFVSIALILLLLRKIRSSRASRSELRELAPVAVGTYNVFAEQQQQQQED